MSKNTRWSPDDFKNKGLAQNADGVFVPVKTITNYGKVDKINPALGGEPEKIVSVSEHMKQFIKDGFSKVNGIPMLNSATEFKAVDELSYGGTLDSFRVSYEIDRRDMEVVAGDYLASQGLKSTKKAIADAIKEIRKQEADDFLMRLNPDKDFFIPGTVRSSKNSKQIFKSKGKDGAPGKMFIGKSFAALKNEKETIWHYNTAAGRFKEATKNKKLPYFVKFTIIAEIDAKFDWVNILQLPLDLMQKAGWLPDDSRFYIVPVVNPRVYINPDKAGIVITVL